MSKRNAVLVVLAYLIGASVAAVGQGTIPPRGITAGTSTITGCTTTQVLFNDAGVLGCDAGLTYNKTTDALSIGTTGLFTFNSTASFTSGGLAFQSALLGPAESTLPAQIQQFSGPQQVLVTANVTGWNQFDFGAGLGVEVGSTDAVTTVRGVSIAAIGGFDVVGSISVALGNQNTIPVYGYSAQPGVIAGRTGVTLYGFHTDASQIAGSATTFYGTYVAALGAASITNPYAFWYDGGVGADCDSDGVTRINDVGIFAYYNPCFAKYTPGLANFERLIVRWGDTGVFGTDNLAYLGVEPGGTGTNRQLNLLGASVHAMTVPGTYAAFRALTTQPTSNYLAVDGTAGLTQTCAAAVTAVTIKNGLITAVTCP